MTALIPTASSLTPTSANQQQTSRSGALALADAHATDLLTIGFVGAIAVLCIKNAKLDRASTPGDFRVIYTKFEPPGEINR
jgi:hypothetical protein